MLFISILLAGLLGFALVNCISSRFSLIEKVGLAFPLGLASMTFLMFLLDFFGIPLTKISVLLIGIATLIACCYPIIRKPDEFVSNIKDSFAGISIKNYNLVWFFFILLIVYIGYMNFSKTIYFPPFDRDSLAGFETIGYVIGQEGTIKGASIFDSDYITNINDPGSYITYTPFVQLSYAYVYLFGAETSKIVPGLMFISFLIAFYGASIRVIPRTGAAIASLFMTLTPEMLAFSSLSGTNVMHAIFASLGIIYMAIWFRSRKTKDLILCGILLSANIWTRTEGIVFIGAVFLLLLIDAIRTKQYKPFVYSASLALIPFICWNLFLMINNMFSESAVIAKPFWEPEKIKSIWKYMWILLTDTSKYGWSFTVFPIAFISNIWFLIKSKDNLNLLFAILLSFLFYLIVLYQLEYLWDSLEHVILFSSKRFLFCFIPLIWFYAFSNQATLIVCRKLEDWLSFNKVTSSQS